MDDRVQFHVLLPARGAALGLGSQMWTGSISSRVSTSVPDTSLQETLFGFEILSHAVRSPWSIFDSYSPISRIPVF